MVGPDTGNVGSPPWIFRLFQYHTASREFNNIPVTIQYYIYFFYHSDLPFLGIGPPGEDYHFAQDYVTA